MDSPIRTSRISDRIRWRLLFGWLFPYFPGLSPCLVVRLDWYGFSLCVVETFYRSQMLKINHSNHLYRFSCYFMIIFLPVIPWFVFTSDINPISCWSIFEINSFGTPLFKMLSSSSGLFLTQNIRFNSTEFNLSASSTNIFPSSSNKSSFDSRFLFIFAYFEYFLISSIASFSWVLEYSLSFLFLFF